MSSFADVENGATDGGGDNAYHVPSVSKAQKFLHNVLEEAMVSPLLKDAFAEVVGKYLPNLIRAAQANRQNGSGPYNQGLHTFPVTDHHAERLKNACADRQLDFMCYRPNSVGQRFVTFETYATTSDLKYDLADDIFQLSCEYQIRVCLFQENGLKISLLEWRRGVPIAVPGGDEEEYGMMIDSDDNGGDEDVGNGLPSGAGGDEDEYDMNARFCDLCVTAPRPRRTTPGSAFR